MPCEHGIYDAGQKTARPAFELRYRRGPCLKRGDLHHHDFYEIGFLVSGDLIYAVEGKLYKVAPGDILLLSPRELHRIYLRSEREDCEYYVLRVDPGVIQRLSTRHTDLMSCLDPASPLYRNVLRPSPEERRRICEMVGKLHDELRSEGFGGELMPECLLTQLLVEINRAARRAVPGEAEIRSARVVSDVADYIGAHYSEELSLETLADRFYVSKYHLSHEFARVVGTGVHRYIVKKRLLMARQLMANGVAPGRVWSEVGFGDYTGFYRAFRSEYGVNPREYAKSVKAAG